MQRLVYFLKISFIFDYVGSSLLLGLSLVEASQDYYALPAMVHKLWFHGQRSLGYSPWDPNWGTSTFSWETRACGHAGFRVCCTWTQDLLLAGSRAQAQWLCHLHLAALPHVGSSWIKNQTHVSWIGRQVLYHWATREELYRFVLTVLSIAIFIQNKLK